MAAAKTEKVILIANDFPPIISGIGIAFYHIWRLLPPDNLVIMAPRVGDWRAVDSSLACRVVRPWWPLGETAAAKLIKTALIMIYTFYYSYRYGVKKVHCGQIVSSGLGGLLCKKVLGIPYAIWVYGSETARLSRYPLLKKLMAKIIQDASHVVANSSFTCEEYEKFGVPPSKLVKITPGVDTEVFKPGAKSQELIEKYGLGEGEVLLTVARLDERKGHDKVIAALPLILKEFPRAKYLIVGCGREEARLKELVAEMGLERAVVFAGRVPDRELPDHYKLGDVFVLPNRRSQSDAMLKGDIEGFGISFLEANSCGVPTVGGRSGGAGEAMLDGVTGFLVDPLSAEEIAEAVVKLLAEGELAKRFGQAARLRVAGNFNWSARAKALEPLL